MTHKTDRRKVMLWSLCCLLLVGHWSVSSQSMPAPATRLEAHVLMPESERRDQVWLALKNTQTVSVGLCVRSTSYNNSDRGGGKYLAHACRAPQNFTLVLPGEHWITRIDSPWSAKEDGLACIDATIVVWNIQGEPKRDSDSTEKVIWEGTAELAHRSYLELTKSRAGR